MGRIAGWILVTLGAVISLGDAFAPHRWLPVPLVVLGLGGAVLLVFLPRWREIRLQRGYLGVGDLPLIGFVGLIAASVLASGAVYGKNLTHALAYTAVVLVFGLFLRLLFAVNGAGLAYRGDIHAAIAGSTFLAAAFAILEFTDANLLHVGIAEMVPFPASGEPYNPQFFIFIRARGFEAESGFLALFLNSFVPVSYLCVRERIGRAAGAVFLLCSVLAFLATFSTAGLFALAVGVGVSAVLYTWDHRVVLIPARRVLAGAVLGLLLLLAALNAPEEVRSSVWSKLTLAAGYSAGERVAAWQAAIEQAHEYPLLGVGVGRTSATSGSGVISFYLTMLKEAGGPALVLILVYFLWIFRKIAGLPPGSAIKYAWALSFTAAVAHYAVVSNIWYPWIWLVCALVLNETVRVEKHPGSTAFSRASRSQGPQPR